MSPAPAPTLENIIRSGDAQRCLEFFSDMPEKERRKLAPLAASMSHSTGEFEPFAPCQRVAVLATASLTEMRRFKGDVLPGWSSDDFDAEYHVLENRRPKWLHTWCTWILEKGYGRWDFVRRLVRDGICPPPNTDQYVLGMISGVSGWHKDWSVLEGLRNDPELLDGMVWRLFEIEGGSPATPIYSGKHPGESAGWPYALHELSKEGRLDRDRLLDESLAALNRDFSPLNSRWFSDFHEYMQPAVEERAARTEKYLDLLANSNPPTVSYAMRALVAIHKSQRLDKASFVARVEPVLYATAKTPVKQALRILASISNDDPVLARQAVHLAVAGLEHSQSDVQALALDIIEPHGDHSDDQMRADIEERAPLMAPSLRARVRQSYPAIEAGAEDTVLDDLDALRGRAEALSEDFAKQSGVAIVMAELDQLSGTLPAIYDNKRARPAPRIRIRSSRRSFFWPIWKFFSPLTISFRFTSPRHIWYPPSEAKLKLDYVLHAIDNPFLESFQYRIPRSDGVRFMFEMLTQLHLDNHYRHSLDDDAFSENPDRWLKGKDVLLFAHQLSDAHTSWGQSLVDVLIRIIDDGRLDGVHFGEKMSDLLAVSAIKPNRWAERLTVAATESPLHAQVVRNALEHALAGMPTERTHNIHTLFELLFNLCFESEEAITNDDCRAFLETFAGNSKAARLARQLLTLKPGEPQSHRRAAAAVALRGRLERAEHWAGR